MPLLAICKFIHNISQGPSPCVRWPPLIKGEGKVAAVLTVQAHSWGRSTKPLILGICKRQERVANFKSRHLMPLKESLVSWVGPRPNLDILKKVYKLALEPKTKTSPIHSKYIPILHCLQMSTRSKPEGSTTEPNSSHTPMNTLLRKITLVYQIIKSLNIQL